MSSSVMTVTSPGVSRSPMVVREATEVFMSRRSSRVERSRLKNSSSSETGGPASAGMGADKIRRQSR